MNSQVHQDTWPILKIHVSLEGAYFLQKLKKRASWKWKTEGKSGNEDNHSHHTCTLTWYSRLVTSEAWNYVTRKWVTLGPNSLSSDPHNYAGFSGLILMFPTVSTSHEVDDGWATNPTVLYYTWFGLSQFSWCSICSSVRGGCSDRTMLPKFL